MSDYFNNDNRICKVLQILEHKRSASLEYLEKKLNVSTKSIKNDIKELNEIFDGNALIQFKLGKYKLYVLEYKQFEKIKENLYLHDDFFNSPKKRMAYVISRLMNDENPVLTEDLAFEMSIGRTTLVGDLKKIREALKKYNIENIPYEDFDVMIYGHIHQGFIQEKEGYVFANPGSISLPKCNTEHSYIIIDGNKIILKRVDGEILQEYELKSKN